MALLLQKELHLLGCGVLCLAAYNSAVAETAAPAKHQGLEEIVVTAQKRTQKLEKVPLSVVSLGAQTLKNAAIERTEDLPTAVSGVRVENEIGYALLSIRGIGNFIVTPGAESDVAVYVNGVYQNNLYGGLQDFIDLSSIEVLKGPQGTLYGRNAVAGVFSINTVNPSLTDPKGKIEATFGDYGLKRVEGYASIPIVQNKLAALVSASYEDRDSYQTNVDLAGGQPRDWLNYTVRGKLLFQPNEDVKFLLDADFQDKTDSSSEFGEAQNNAFGYAFGGSRPTSFYLVDTDTPSYTHTQKGGLALTGDVNLGSFDYLGDVSLTSISAYRFARSIAVVDDDATPAPLFGYNQNVAWDRTFTQEIRIQNNGERLSWMLGGFIYYDQPGINLFLVSDILPTIPGLINGHVNRHSQSFFTQESYKITERLSLTGGIRFTTETDRMAAQSFTLPSGFVVPSPNVGKEPTWNSFTYHASLDYDFGPAIVYASISTGFKSGVFNITDLSNASPVSPEKITSYEIGVKGTLLNRRIFYSLDGFWQNYSNLQVQIVNAQNGATQTQNAGAARSPGIEAETRIRVTDALTGFVSFTAIDPIFTRFPNYSAITAASPSAPPSPNANSTLNVAGNQLPYSSKFSGNIGATYSTFFEGFGSADFTVNLSGTSRFYGSPENQLIESQAGYIDLNGTLTLTPTALKGGYVRLWIKNATDVHRYSYIETENFGTVYSPAPPLTFGATLGYSF